MTEPAEATEATEPTEPIRAFSMTRKRVVENHPPLEPWLTWGCEYPERPHTFGESYDDLCRGCVLKAIAELRIEGDRLGSSRDSDEETKGAMMTLSQWVEKVIPLHHADLL